MKKYIFKRVLYSIVAILVLLLLLFTMLQYMPGSPFNDDKLSQEQIAKKWNTSQATISRFEKKLLQKLNRYYHHEADKNN